MALVNTTVHMVEQAPKSGCHQCLCPRVISSCLPVSLWETLQDQQVGLTQVPFNLLLLPWVLEQVRFCMCPFRVESLFPTVRWVSGK